MKLETFGDDGDDPLVFVLGWGNRPRFDGVRWLVDHLVEAGYRVDTLEIPRTITDFESEYLDPVQSHLDDLAEYRLLSHSTGGLITRYVADDEPITRTYLSPWWGFHESLDNPVVSLAMKLPVSTPILPAKSDRAELGELATDEWYADAPDRAAPTFLREAKRAQERMPPFDTDDAVFYSSTDTIVSPDAIEVQTPRENRIAYEGGHELFNSRSRDEHIEQVLAAVDAGADAL
ncbi:alpha/beta hydrolase [Halorientalis sp. IM1011]|uniref:alpha/beta hydrolase n=1 Tax=Halorientalis sp. IM1011 TaxID=1932360 RepID=UPI00097CCA56|nr:alpha/beta hydrolase [Halorientalis sp. IM1011]AQL42049.1 alpha/beta hydrolase [Halorientalis sp. IM1011]